MDYKKKHRTVLRISFTNKANELEQSMGQSDIDIECITVYWDIFRENFDSLKLADREIYDFLLENDVTKEDLLKEMEASESYKKRFLQLLHRYETLVRSDVKSEASTGNSLDTVLPVEVAAKKEDIVQKSIGIFGRWHLWICLAIFMSKFFVAMHQLSIIFIAPKRKFNCSNANIGECDDICASHDFDESIFTNTIQSEWDLVCSKEYLVDITQTITMLGILFGNMLFGYLSDKFGRKMPLVWACILQGISGTAAGFSPWFGTFLMMRFFAALATGGSMITSFVLIVELVGIKWRTVAAIVYQLPFNFGHLFLPGIAYFLRDWSSFQIAISAPSIILIFYWYILPESPRWLLVGGKEDEAVAVMERAAKFNKLPTKNIKSDVAEYLSHKSQDGEIERRKGNFMDLIRTPIMRTYTIANHTNWLTCGLCFFGVSQFVGHLGGNIFANVALSAVIQIPSTLFACWSTKAWGRKITLIVGDVLAGVATLMIATVPSEPTWIKTTLSLVAMFGLALAFPTVYIYSGELFPTTVRNVAVGTSSMSARVGSMVAPFIASLISVREWLPPLIFGIAPLISALLCLLLPETLDCKLPDTVEEAEMFKMKDRGVKGAKNVKKQADGTKT